MKKSKYYQFGLSIIKNPLFSGSFVMVSGSMLANVVNYIYHLVMGRLLGPVDYGTLSSIFSILYVVSIVPISSSVAIVKFISAAQKQKDIADTYQAIKSFILKISLIGTLIILLLSPFVSHFLHIDQILAVALTGLVFLFSLLTLVNQATSQGLLKFSGSVNPTILSSISKLIIGVLLVLVGFSVTGAIFAVLISMVLAYLLSAYYVRKIKMGNRNNFNLKPFIKFSLPALMQALAFTSMFTVDVILVKHFLPPFEAGLYAALSTLGKIIYFASSPVTAVMFPLVSKRHSSGEKYLKVFLLALGANLAISLVVLIFYTLFPRVIIGSLYGKEYLGASQSLVWMGLFISIYTAANLLINFMLSIGKTNIVYIPLVFAILQIIGISIWHESLQQVIQVSLVLVVLMSTWILYIILPKGFKKLAYAK